MTTTEYEVSGMTCGHCVSSVTAEVSGIDGVTGVQVDLATGIVTVTSDHPVDATEVSNAVRDAGYQVVP